MKFDKQNLLSLVPYLKCSDFEYLGNPFVQKLFMMINLFIELFYKKGICTGLICTIQSGTQFDPWLLFANQMAQFY